MTESWLRRAQLRGRAPWLAFSAIAVLGAAVVAILLAPVATWFAGQTVRGIKDPAQRAAAINAVRQTLLAAAGGLVALLGLTATLRTFLLSRRTQQLDRYAKSVALLGAKELDQRIGGVYALEQLANESVSDSEAVTNVLAAFVRRRAEPVRSEDPSKVPTEHEWSAADSDNSDVQAALTVLGRRSLKVRGLRLNGLHLAGIDLRDARLDNADLSASALQNSDLRGARMRSCNLAGCDLSNTRLNSADLQMANLTGAVLHNARLIGADLRGCTLRAAELGRADLTGARFTPGALDQATTEGAKLPEST